MLKRDYRKYLIQFKMKAGEIVKVLEDFAPCSIQESWDNSGFIIGNEGQEVKAVLLALDCTPAVIDEAIESGADMIITHHPLIFSPLKRITGSTVVERMVEQAIKNNLVIYSIHTNIDKVISGVSGLMAENLGLCNVRLLTKDKDEEYGLGIVGEFKARMDFEEIVSLVKEKFSVKNIRSSKPTDKKIKKIALCGGSGASLISAAKDSGAQILITGDLKYHDFSCEDGFMVMDIGHFESETGVLELLRSILSKNLVTFTVRISENNNNLIYYY